MGNERRSGSLNRGLSFERTLERAEKEQKIVDVTTVEILGKIKALPLSEQSRIYEALKEIFRQTDVLARGKREGSDLARAARSLDGDYRSDPELTAFTALDGEDFHAPR
jgi:hypothetical protein